MIATLIAPLFCVAIGSLLIGFGDNCSGTDQPPVEDTSPIQTEAKNPSAAEARQATLTLKLNHDRVASVAFSADGKRLASASSDGTVKVWEVTPRAEGKR